MGIKSMIDRCRERMRAGACATCDHKEACVASRWQEALAFAAPEQPRGRNPVQLSSFSRTGFSALLGEVAKEFERRMSAPKPGFRREVERALKPLLAGGDVGIDRIAAELGVSRQTLYRRLKAEGVTFEQVLDALRRDLALRYVRRERLGVKQAAYRLGFSEPAAFSRAFKRWTGYSPSTIPGSGPSTMPG